MDVHPHLSPNSGKQITTCGGIPGFGFGCINPHQNHAEPMLNHPKIAKKHHLQNVFGMVSPFLLDSPIVLTPN
jgi:hypothetical protein